MKKTLLSIGTLVSTIAPVASVIACGDGDVPGHEAPYSITIQADATKPTQANVFVDLKGFVSESYLKEIKSRIAESIVAANKDALKYSTIKIYIGDKTAIYSAPNTYRLLIDSSPLIDTNKNDLDVVFNLIDTPFDNFMKQIKTTKYFSQFFQKEAWENQHHAIDKVDKDEIKRNLLRLFGYDDSNPDTIDFTYKIISDKFIDFTITRTNVVANPELHSTGFQNQATSYFDFLEGDSLHMISAIKEDFSLKPLDDCVLLYTSPKHPSNSYDGAGHGGSPQSFLTQSYKIARYLLKQNGYDGKLIYNHYLNGNVAFLTTLNTLGNSASKVFAYGDNGQNFGIHFDSLSNLNLRKYKIWINFETKTFKIINSNRSDAEKQWIFGKDGNHLIVEPSHEWSMTLEGTYELNDAGNAAETISALTNAIVTDGTDTINILDSSAKRIAKFILNDFAFFIDK